MPDTADTTDTATSFGKSPTVRGARYWARSLTDAELAREIPHARGMGQIAVSYRPRRYGAFYAVTVGVYRAEQRRRAAIAKAEG